MEPNMRIRGQNRAALPSVPPLAGERAGVRGKETQEQPSPSSPFGTQDIRPETLNSLALTPWDTHYFQHRAPLPTVPPRPGERAGVRGKETQEQPSPSSPFGTQDIRPET